MSRETMKAKNTPITVSEDCLPLFEKLCPLVVDLAQEDVLKVTSEMIERLSD